MLVLIYWYPIILVQSLQRIWRWCQLLLWFDWNTGELVAVGFLCNTLRPHYQMCFLDGKLLYFIHMVQCNMILKLQVDETLNSLKTTHSSPSQASYGCLSGLGSSTFRSTWVKYKYFFIFASTSTSSSTQSTWKTSSTSSTFSIKYESSTSTLVTNNSISRSTTDGLYY